MKKGIIISGIIVVFVSLLWIASKSGANLIVANRNKTDNTTATSATEAPSSEVATKATTAKDAIGVDAPAANAKDTRTIKLYYYNVKTDNGQCTKAGLAAVQRKIPQDNDFKKTMASALNMFLKGDLTAEERAQGIDTEYPLDGLKLSKVDFDKTSGKLTLTLEDLKHKTTGGSCRVDVLYYQLEATIMQFGEVSGFKLVSSDDGLFAP
jgi:hypothetical protein